MCAVACVREVRPRPVDIATWAASASFADVDQPTLCVRRDMVSVAFAASAASSQKCAVCGCGLV
eukprot:7579463-Pyramimonas_sp.AAC.1